ncbi:hypothetical protein AGMMS49938_09420 [Fibrobacterales bacterium]|nr:hypothetical protein AGMMS49938_09420 [Fibrobacterales bacterium]
MIILNDSKELQRVKSAYDVAMSFLENEGLKKKPDQIGAGSWKQLKDDLHFLDKKSRDRVINWLIVNYPPQMNNTLPHLNENERHVFDSDSYRLLLRSYRVRMVPERFIEELIVHSAEREEIQIEGKDLHNLLAKCWDDFMQEMPQADLH